MMQWLEIRYQLLYLKNESICVVICTKYLICMAEAGSVTFDAISRSSLLLVPLLAGTFVSGIYIFLLVTSLPMEMLHADSMDT